MARREKIALNLPTELFVGEGLETVTLDWEAEWTGDDGSTPRERFALMVSWRVKGGPMEHIVARDMTMGVFDPGDLARYRSALFDSQGRPRRVRAHNALTYDLPVTNGVLRSHGLPTLPSMPCQDTLSTTKVGQIGRLSLRRECRDYHRRYPDIPGLEKLDSPDWDRIKKRDPQEWNRMVAYCDQDVHASEALAIAHARAGIPDPTVTWHPTRSRRG